MSKPGITDFITEDLHALAEQPLGLSAQMSQPAASSAPETPAPQQPLSSASKSSGDADGVSTNAGPLAAASAVSTALKLGVQINDLSARLGGPTLLGDPGASNKLIIDLLKEISSQLDDLSSQLTAGFDAIREDIDRLEINAVYDEATALILGLDSNQADDIRSDLLAQSRDVLSDALNVTSRLLADPTTNASVIGDVALPTLIIATSARIAAISAYSDAGFGEFTATQQLQQASDLIADLFTEATPGNVTTAPIYEVIERSLTIDTDRINPTGFTNNDAERFHWLVTAELKGSFTDDVLIRIWVDDERTSLAPNRSVGGNARDGDGVVFGDYPERLIGAIVTDISDNPDNALSEANALTPESFLIQGNNDNPASRESTLMSLIFEDGTPPRAEIITDLIQLNIAALSPDDFLNFANLYAILASGQQLSGDNFNNEIIGGESFDFIEGQGGRDTIDGLGENDGLQGGSGNDLIIGGDGLDTLHGDDGNDTLIGGDNSGNAVSPDETDKLFGGAGSDSLLGSGGDDILLGETGRDQLLGEDGDDILDGGNDDDTLEGGAGRDYLDGGNGNNFLHGGDGDDTLFVERGNNTLNGGAGNDDLTVGVNSDVVVLSSGGGHDTLYGFIDGQTIIDLSAFDREFVKDAIEQLQGTDFTISLSDRTSLTIQGMNARDFTLDDVILSAFPIIGTDLGDDLFGGPLGDRIEGAAGNDRIISFEGADRNFGNDGHDGIFAGSGDDFSDGGSGHDTLTGGDGNDTLNGGLDNDEVFGGDGIDQLNGATGHDTLVGNGGADNLNGGLGEDILQGGDDEDTLVGGNGNDQLFGGKGADVSFGGQGADLVDGGDNTDLLSGGTGNDSLVGGRGNDSLYGGNGLDTILGGNDADLISGFNGDDSLFGNLGSDVILGGNGQDFLSGGNDDDTLVGNRGRDTLFGGLGADELDGGDADDLLSGGDGNDLLQTGQGSNSALGGNGADTILAGTGNDSLYGNQGDDSIEAGAGDDLINLGDGDDFATGGDGQDILYGTLGNDTLVGGVDADSLFGGNDDDSLSGNDGADTLKGGMGDDTLEGGAGDDFLEGGAGNDFYIFDDEMFGSTFPGSGHDTIFGFEAGDGPGDIIRIYNTSSLNLNTFQLLMNATTDNGADTVIDLGNGNTITLVGVTKADLDTDDFILS